MVNVGYFTFNLIDFDIMLCFFNGVTTIDFLSVC